jgi:hypothetical protein
VTAPNQAIQIELSKTTAFRLSAEWLYSIATVGVRQRQMTNSEYTRFTPEGCFQHFAQREDNCLQDHCMAEIVSDGSATVSLSVVAADLY